MIWGIGGGGTGNQVIFQYYARTNSLFVTVDVSSPALLPRVSVSADGSYAMVGWSLLSGSYIKARYPNVLASPNITGHAIDSKNGIIYGGGCSETRPLPECPYSLPQRTRPTSRRCAIACSSCVKGSYTANS